jgi:hypothetical protein
LITSFSLKPRAIAGREIKTIKNKQPNISPKFKLANAPRENKNKNKTEKNIATMLAYFITDEDFIISPPKFAVLFNSVC